MWQFNLLRQLSAKATRVIRTDFHLLIHVIDPCRSMAPRVSHGRLRLVVYDAERHRIVVRAHAVDNKCEQGYIFLTPIVCPIGMHEGLPSTVDASRQIVEKVRLAQAQIPNIVLELKSQSDSHVLIQVKRVRRIVVPQN